MKKIGIIDKVETSGPGTKNVIYKIPEVDGYVYVSYLSATIIDDQNAQLKRVNPKYNRNELYFLGDIIEYNDETNSIHSFDLFREMTEEEINQINYIYQKYSEMLNETSNFELDFKLLLEASTLDEMKRVMKNFHSKRSYDELIDLKTMLNSIQKQMIMRKMSQLKR